VEPHLNPIEGHSLLRQFKFVRSVQSDQIEMFVKNTMLDAEEWKGLNADGAGGGWVAFKQTFPDVKLWPTEFPANRRILIDPETNDAFRYSSLLHLPVPTPGVV
jgi:hypothetical protein